MTLLCDSYAVIGLLEREKRDFVLGHELRTDSDANKTGEFGATQGYVLLDLNDVCFIRAAFRLYRKNVMCSAPVDPDINLVRFYLPHSGHRRTQVIL